jgi:hypothetical protein
MCTKNGPQITTDEKLLLRQVLTKWFDEDGLPTTQAFWPWRNIDDGCLSVDRSTLTTAENAFKLFTSPEPDGFNRESGGVWSMSMSDVQADDLSLWADPVAAKDNEPANPSHALMDFEKYTKKQRESLGRIFKVKSLARGRLFPPSAS